MDNNWYYNLFFVNNFYFEPKLEEYLEVVKGDISTEDAIQNQFAIQQRNACLPWTWFYAVYM